MACGEPAQTRLAIFPTTPRLAFPAISLNLSDAEIYRGNECLDFANDAWGDGWPAKVSSSRLGHLHARRFPHSPLATEEGLSDPAYEGSRPL